MGIALGIIVFLVSAVSFSLAMYLHIAITLVDAINTDLYSAKMVVNELDPEILERIFTRGREIYESIPEEIRSQRLSEEYLSYFDELRTDEYEETLEKLSNLAVFEDLKWLDLRFPDYENSRWVYLMDTHELEDGRYTPGYWEYGSETVNTFREESEEEQEKESLIWEPIVMLNDLRYIDLRDIDRFSTTADFFDPKTGESLGSVGTGEYFEEYRESISMFLTLHLMALVVFLVIIFMVSDFLVNRLMVRPLVKLSKAAAEYADKDDVERSTGHFDVVEIKTHDELLQLKNSMVKMESDLVRYIQNLSKIAAERERENVEMEMSARIQTSLLPQKLENYIGEKNFEISAFIDPAQNVGGDFYDYYLIDDDHVGITIADVSGKGVPAALFMVVTKTLLQMAGVNKGSPSEIIKKVNRQLIAQNNEMMFVTVFFGIYTISEKKMNYINAGHEDIALFREKKGGFDLLIEEHDMVMGVMPDAEFTERTIYLESGDRMFLYTDGVPEAKDEADEMFGNRRMIDELNSHKQLSGKNLLVEIRKDISSFVGNAPQFDDVTMLLLEIR